MRNSIFRLIYAVALFIAIVCGMELLSNQSSSDVTADMKAATLPVITMQAAGRDVNELHGYVSERDISHFHTVVTPIAEDRKVCFTLDTYGEEMAGLSFEVRTVDGARLIQDGTVEDITAGDNNLINAELAVKDLIEQNTEYMLVLLFDRTDGSVVRYYSRIIECDVTAASEELAFAQKFHDSAVRNKDDGTVSSYFSQGTDDTANADANSTYASVSIHSNYNQVMYGDIAPTEIVAPVITINDLQDSTCMLRMDYILTSDAESGSVKYDCTEYYRLDSGSGGVTLADYYRSMEQVFDPEVDDNYASDVITLGITDSNMRFEESDGGSAYAFVNAGRLYECTPASSEVSQVFAFADADSLDERENYRESGIRILDVDETGSVDFLVYGYMNRGEHEGELGAAIYIYNGEFHTVEELAFLPYDGSYELLKTQVEKLSYFNNKNSTLFILINETLYEVNTTDRTVITAADNLTPGSLEVSKSGQMVAWESQGSGTGQNSITLMNFSTLKDNKIDGDSGEQLQTLGFIGEDLIYGTARENDVITNAAGQEDLYMHSVDIVDSDISVLEHYEMNGYYVTGADVKGTQITLHRAKKNADDGLFVTVDDDQILTADSSEQGTNYVSQVVTDKYETTITVNMRGFDGKTVKFVKPKTVIYEGSRSLSLPVKTSEDSQRCYVYDMYGAEGIYNTPAEAVKQADENSGEAIDETGRYIWKHDSNAESNQIMAITGVTAVEGEDSLTACLDAIFEFEGVAVSAENELQSNNNILSIIEDSIPGSVAYNLAGCPLDSVLYYVSCEKPVLALFDGGSSAMLIVGYNSSIVVVADPADGTLIRMDRDEAEEKFTKGGGYVCYQMKAD